MPIVLYAITNLIVGILACLRNFFARDNTPYSLTGLLFLALLPAVGFGYKRYERFYQHGPKLNPLLQCFVLRSLRRFNRWFVALASIPVTAWVVRLILAPKKAVSAPGDEEEGAGAVEQGTLDAIIDSAGWAITEIGDWLAWLFWFAVLILPVFGVLWLLLITIPAQRLKRLERRYGISTNRTGHPEYHALENGGEDGKWPPY